MSGDDAHEADAVRAPAKVVPERTFPSWEEFEKALSTVLSRMAVDTYLIISRRPPASAESEYYVQFAQGGRSGFLAEAVSNQYLMGRSALTPIQEEQIVDLGWQFPSPRAKSPTNFSREWPMPTPFDDVSKLAVRTLREIYRAKRTSELTYRSFARGGHDFAQPALGIDAVAPSASPSPSLPATPTVTDLRPVVEAAVKQLFNLTEVAYDADGDIPIRFGSAMVFVRLVNGHPPIVALFSPVLWGIPGSPDLLAAINEINKSIRFGRVVWTGREVMASIELPAFHVSADDIGFVCLQLGSIADHFDDQLQKRFGGKTTFEPTKELLN